MGSIIGVGIFNLPSSLASFGPISLVAMAPTTVGALALALRREAISNYGGIRIDSQGRRFRIEGARLWTLRNEAGEACGQAACFESWWWL